jgi:hypothetical protein
MLELTTQRSINASRRLRQHVHEHLRYSFIVQLSITTKRKAVAHKNANLLTTIVLRNDGTGLYAHPLVISL